MNLKTRSPQTNTGRTHVLWIVLLCFLGMVPLQAATGRLTLRTQQTSGFMLTSYNRPSRGETVRDTVFVYNRDQVAAPSVTALTDTVSVFRWFRMQGAVLPASPFYEVSGTAASVDTLASGGYLIAMETVLPDTTLRDSVLFWLLPNNGFTFRLEKDSQKRMVRGRHCTYFDFFLDPSAPSVTPSSLTYFNPSTGEQYVAEIPVNFTIQAGAGNPGPCRLYEEGGAQYLRSGDLYALETRYTFTASDDYGHQQTDMVTALPMMATADFEIKAQTDASGKYSAPLVVTFENKSVNADNYRWDFGDQETSETTQLTHPEHTYTTPKTYNVTLDVSNASGCVSSAVQSLSVDASDLRLANVFTPNGDGQNDRFVPYNVSIRNFSIRIFTRSGRLVYSHSGDDMRFWEGWDGRTQDGQDASEGVYYYVIEAKGYGRKQTYEAKNNTGFLYLYR